MKTAKYLTVGLATSFIPFGDDLVGIVAEEILGEAIKKPSFGEIYNDITRNTEQKVVAKKAHEFTLITKDSDDFN